MRAVSEGLIASLRKISVLPYDGRMRFMISLTLLIVSSAGAALGILFPITWVLAPLSLALFFYGLLKAQTWKTVLVHGLVFGLFTGGAGIWWFWDTLPLDWLGLKNLQVGWMLVFLSWGPVTLMFALVTALGALLIWSMRRLPCATLLIALLWMLTEEARMWGFSWLTYAERGFLGPHFSSTSIGYPLAESSYLLQLGAFGGVFVLNFAAALFAGVLAYAALRDISSRMIPGAIVLLMVAFLPFVAPAPPQASEPLTVALGYMNIPVGTIHAENQFTNLLTQMVAQAPEASLYVLPEEKRLNSPFVDELERKAFYKTLFKEREVLVLSSNHVPAEPTGFNIFLWYENGHGDLLHTYSKRFFMPGGEYMPHAMLAVFSLAPDSALTDFVNALPTKAPEPTPLSSVPLGRHKVGGIVCSDFLSPGLSRDLARIHGADILVNSANPAWFHDSPTLYTKTLQISKVHAVQGRSYFLQASNGSPSFAIDPYGQLIAESPATGSGVMPVTLFK